jgi:hypothetical protein
MPPSGPTSPKPPLDSPAALSFCSEMSGSERTADHLDLRRGQRYYTMSRTALDYTGQTGCSYFRSKEHDTARTCDKPSHALDLREAWSSEDLFFYHFASRVHRKGTDRHVASRVTVGSLRQCGCRLRRTRSTTLASDYDVREVAVASDVQ